MRPLAVSLAGWYVGYVIATIVIAIVVVLVASILGLARRIGVQALAITAALEEGRIATLPMWEVSKVNDALRNINRNAQQARAVLEMR
jgi:hypothetical protein